MHTHVTTVKDSWDFAYFIRDLVRDEDFKGRADLDAYLRALWGMILKHQETAPSWMLFAYVIEEAFAADPVPFDSTWLDYQNPPDLESDLSPFEALQQMILFQIADLHRMEAAGTLDLSPEILFNGVDSPTGNHWFNFTSFSFLDCGAASADDSVHREECSWLDLAIFLRLGQIYE